MASHGPYGSKKGALTAATKYRKKGLKASIYKTSKGWKLSSTR